jgi:MFS family permease
MMKSKTSLFFLRYFAFASFIFGAKLCLIEKYANATPFWDQWNAEADLLYKPFVDGTLKFTDLIAPYNEHRILTARLLDLSELILNGIWNPLLQMVVNAGIHILAMVILIALITRIVGQGYSPALLLFSALLFGLPLGWENTLSGFQASFYLVLLFSIVSLWFTTTLGPFSLGWYFGLLCAVLAFFSLSSGAFVFAASAAIGFIFYFSTSKKTNKQLFAAALMAGFFTACVALTPVNGNQVVDVNSAPRLITALLNVLCWPSPDRFFGLLQNLPALVFCVWMFRRRPAPNDPKWFLISLIILMLGMASGIAYGRTNDPLLSRYLDLFTISILINFSCSLVLFEEYKRKWKTGPFLCLMAWVLAAGLALQAYHGTGFLFYTAAKTDQEKNVKNYVATGDIGDLKDKPFLQIPYPPAQAEHLASILDTPEIRGILPPDIAPPDRPVKEGRFDKAVNLLIENYSVFIGIGLLSAVICGLLGFFASAKKSEKIPA